MDRQIFYRWIYGYISRQLHRQIERQIDIFILVVIGMDKTNSLLFILTLDLTTFHSKLGYLLQYQDLLFEEGSTGVTRVGVQGSLYPISLIFYFKHNRQIESKIIINLVNYIKLIIVFRKAHNLLEKYPYHLSITQGKRTRIQKSRFKIKDRQIMKQHGDQVKGF